MPTGEADPACGGAGYAPDPVCDFTPYWPQLEMCVGEISLLTAARSLSKPLKQEEQHSTCTDCEKK
jgi:hypothetical protein